MLDIKICQKEYDAVYCELTGKKLKTDVSLYNNALCSDAKVDSEIRFIVYSDLDVLQANEEYIIWGIGYKEHFWSIDKKTKYLHVVDLIDDGIYKQNSKSGHVKGKVKEVTKYKMNFEYKDVKEKENTFINFIKLVGYETDKLYFEMFALCSFKINLLENIFRYKNTTYSDYTYNDFVFLKSELIKQIKINNQYRYQLLTEVKAIDSFEKLAKYVRKNRIKFEDESDLLYSRNDDVKNIYPVNMVGTNISLNLYDGFKFNSALPFYFQYRNYKKATLILAQDFFDAIINVESTRFNNELKKLKCYFGNEELKEWEPVNTVLYGLYFPLLMLFRQSVELAFKLIFINEDLKKQKFSNQQEIKRYAKKIDTHRLHLLLDLIKDYLEQDVYSFFYQLASFIYYNEGTDPSFSRYILNNDAQFNNFKKITIYFMDLKNYIDEFYLIMDKVFSAMNFGFDINNVFTKG